MGTAYETLRADLLEDGTLLRVLLDRPKGNVLTGQMMREIADVLAQSRGDRHLRLVLLRGAGGIFSYGASVEEHRPEQAPDMLRTFHALARAVAAYPVPVAALVEGRCLGGGFELVLCCHFIFATESARFACPEIKLGVFPPVLAVLGALRLGSALAEKMLLSGGDLESAVAERAGLLTGRIPDAEEPESVVLDWYRANVRPLSAFALRQATAGVRQGSGILAQLGSPLDAVERQYLEAVVPSRDGVEGIEAFLARRSPVWQDA